MTDRGVFSQVSLEQSKWCWQSLHQERHLPDEVSPPLRCRLLPLGYRYSKRLPRIWYCIPRWRQRQLPPSRPSTQENYLSQPLEQKVLPVVKVVEYLRSSRISFTSWQQRCTAVFADELIHQPWDTLIGLNPVTIAATKHRISDF
jgi:hypothetical protein